MQNSYDIAIVGSGFAGSLMAMIARRLGYSVVLLEKGKHPRVVIGESSTPLSNLLLEELAETYDLPMLKPLTKWGSWQNTYPELACGLKRGFSFFHHNHGHGDRACFTSEDQLFVAASPHDEIADTHWFRADSDKFFVEQAQLLGVQYIDELAIQGSIRKDGSWHINGVKASSHPISIRAAFLMDATGPRGFLHRALGLSEAPIPNYPATSALYCHFKGVGPFSNQAGIRLEDVPFPIDDAAVHHIFDGGWIWVLQFNNGWTSAGVAATEKCSRRFGLNDGEAGWHRVLESLPGVKTAICTRASGNTLYLLA